MYNDISFELYKVFRHTAKAGSISKAAKQMHISQPGVSQAIKQLETLLGAQVFARTAKGIRLTKEGTVLLEYIEQAYNLIRSGENKFREMLRLESGEIRIGASDTLSTCYLIPYLQTFHRQFPAVRIKVTNRTSPETISLLLNGEVDLGIVNLPVKSNDHLCIEEAMTIQDSFVAGPAFRHVAATPINLQQLNRYPLILLESGSTTRKFVDEFARSHGSELKPEIELGSVDLIIRFAIIGLGIGYVVKDFVAHELKTEQLFPIHLVEEIPKRSIGIVTRKEISVTAAANQFIQMLRQS